MHRDSELIRRDNYMVGDYVFVDGKYYKWRAADYNRSVAGMSHVHDIPLSVGFFAINGYAVDKQKNIYIDEDFNITLSCVNEDDGGLYCPQPGLFLSSVSDFQKFLRLRGEFEKADKINLVRIVNLP